MRSCRAPVVSTPVMSVNVTVGGGRPPGTRYITAAESVPVAKTPARNSRRVNFSVTTAPSGSGSQYVDGRKRPQAPVTRDRNLVGGDASPESPFVVDTRRRSGRSHLDEGRTRRTSPAVANGEPRRGPE